MPIFLKNSWNVPPARWGSPADVQYAVKVNSEKIYEVDPDSNRIIMPLFWGFPLFDYSGYNNHAITNYGTHSKNGELYFDGNDYVSIGYKDFPVSTFTYSVRLRPESINAYRDIIGAQGNSIEYRVENDGRVALIKSGLAVIGYSTSVLKLGITQSIAVTYDTYGNWAHFFDGNDAGSGNTLMALLAPTYLYLSKSQYLTYFLGGMLDVRVNSLEFTHKQISLFNDLPYGLYQPVSRPVYLLPTAPSGWTGTINGITNPAKILGIPVANISKVNGIASS